MKRILAATAVVAVCVGALWSAPGTALATPARPTPPATEGSGTPGGTADRTDGADRDGADRDGADGTDRLEDVRKRLDRLYHEASVATDAFNAAEEAISAQASTIADLNEKIEMGQRRLDRLKDRAGAAARAQYRSGGVPDGTRLALSDDPELFLEGVGRVLAGQRAAKGLITQLSRSQENLRIYAKDAVANQEKLTEARDDKDTARREVTRKLAAAEALEASLVTGERERLRRMEEDSGRAAQQEWLGTWTPKDAEGSGDARGKDAVAYATRQLGLPYEWGAEGPRSFDCSGLTQQAWRAAGVPIPRTSQEQWRSLPRVSQEDLRPGDLIIYRADASHVGMYIGDGSIIHSPRPGRTVTVAGAGSMPILGVVRPDAG
ncbi:NlpC/P60 family protein [Streptomyces sp. JNUCC 64]